MLWELHRDSCVALQDWDITASEIVKFDPAVVTGEMAQFLLRHTQIDFEAINNLIIADFDQRFALKLENDRLSVSVFEGKVRWEAPLEAALIDAPEEAKYSDPEQWREHIASAAASLRSAANALEAKLERGE